MSKYTELLRLRFVLPLAEKLKGLKVTHWYYQILKMNTWSSQQIQDWQNQHLHDFVCHAYVHTKYYRELFDKLGLTPDDIQTIEDLRKLPVLDKDTIRMRFHDFVPDNINQISYRLETTGGTTGEPMKYLVSEDTWGYLNAVKILAWKTTSYQYGDKFAALGSASLFRKKASWVRRIYDWIRREIPLNSMSLSNDICQNYIDKMRRENICYIYGYASAIYLLAKYANENQLDVSFIKGVFTTSENLTPIYRAMIEKTFHCRVMDCYGCRDAGVACYEIQPGKYYVGYNSITEIINPLQNGMGTIVSTNILNYAFPLLRYDYGDMVQMDTSNKAIYNGQVITQIYGRVSDVLQLDNGYVLTSPGFTILMNKFDVVAYDIQKISGLKVKMLVQPVIGKWNDEQEIVLKKEMQRLLGDGCSFSIEYVNYFEPLKNGKRRYFMNNVDIERE